MIILTRHVDHIWFINEILKVYAFMSRVKVNSLMVKCNYKARRFERRAVLEVETTLQELPSTTKLEKNNKNGIDIR